MTNTETARDEVVVWTARTRGGFRNHYASHLGRRLAVFKRTADSTGWTVGIDGEFDLDAVFVSIAAAKSAAVEYVEAEYAAAAL